MTSDTHSLPRWKLCNGCSEPRSIDEFRRVYSDRDWPRHHECNECRNCRERARRRQRKQSTTKKKILRLLAAEKRLEPIEVVLNKMLCQCGGRRRFGETLGEIFRSGSPDNRRHANYAIVNLVTVVEAERARLDARFREEEQARASLSDPGMRESLRQLAIEELHLNAWSVCQVAARSHSKEAVDAVLENARPTLRKRLIAEGWTPPPDATTVSA